MLSVLTSSMESGGRSQKSFLLAERSNLGVSLPKTYILERTARCLSSLNLRNVKAARDLDYLILRPSVNQI